MFYDDDTPEWIKQLDRKILGWVLTIGISVAIPIIVIRMLSL